MVVFKLLADGSREAADPYSRFFPSTPAHDDPGSGSRHAALVLRRGESDLSRRLATSVCTCRYPATGTGVGTQGPQQNEQASSIS